MSKKIYRAAAIGRTGGGNYGHGLHLPYKELDNVEFIAVADAHDAGREEAKAASGAKRAYADYHEMLEKEELDIVSVCPRWTDLRVEMVLACVEAGCNIYCEKPVAMNLADGDTMIAAVDNAGLKMAVSHQQVYQHSTQKIKSLLDEGRIGQVHSIYTDGKQDTRGGGEDMIVLGTHTFNMMRYFFGDVAWMFSHITAEGHEITPDDVREPTEPVGLVAGDSIHSYFAFKSGVSGHYYSRRYRELHGTKIMGSKGMMSWRGGNLVISPNPEASGKEEIVKLRGSTLHTGNEYAIIDLIDAIENDREPISSGRAAVAALEMILAAYESQITGKRVEFPMKDRTHPLERFRSG